MELGSSVGSADGLRWLEHGLHSWLMARCSPPLANKTLAGVRLTLTAVWWLCQTGAPAAGSGRQ
jgi:hypothetical protein